MANGFVDRRITVGCISATPFLAPLVLILPRDHLRLLCRAGAVGPPDSIGPFGLLCFGMTTCMVGGFPLQSISTHITLS